MDERPQVPIGVRMYTDGRSKAHRQTFLRRLVSEATLGIYVGALEILVLLIILSFVSRTALVLLLLAASTVFMPARPLWTPFLYNPVFKLWREYFQYSVAIEEQLDPTKPYIIAGCPHGVLPFSQMLCLSGKVRQLAWPGKDMYGLAADSVFFIPLWRHVLAWLGAAPATAKNLRRFVRNGHAVGIIPGGIAELYMASPDADHIFINKRKGFVRVAVEEGVAMVPAYHFGNSQLLSFGPKWLRRLGRRLRLALGWGYGPWGLPIPHAWPLFMAVGRAVEVQKVARDDPGFDAAVDEAHGRFVGEMRRVYDKYAPMYGWEAHPLVLH